MVNDVATLVDEGTVPRTRPGKMVLFAAFFLLETTVFAILPLSARMPVSVLVTTHGGITAALLVAALLSRRSPTGRQYWPVLYAFFVAGTAVLLSTLFGHRLLEMLPLSTASPSWIAAAKLSETLWRVIPILLLMAIGGADARSMYLSRGRLGLGLAVGIAGFVGFAALAFLPVTSQHGGSARLLTLSPWILMFVLANGFSEELLFRGLFLGRFEPFLGKGPSNLLAAAAFTLLHAQVTYVPGLLLFLAVLFPLACAWGYLMQKTGSLWGPALLHAGADCMIVFGIFATM